MSSGLAIERVEHALGKHHTGAMAIYRAAFPEWEREPEDAIGERIASGLYRLYVGLEAGVAAGFYIVEESLESASATLTYLAVREGTRARGVGSELCSDAVARFRKQVGFNWLFVEGQDRHASFYGRLGFLRVDIAYGVPRYDGPDSVPMHLLALPRDRQARTIPRESLRVVVEESFRQGYRLAEDDPRLARQLGAICGDVALSPWPPGQAG